ncbi:MAG: type II toxin-antitoxin system VapC family toxin [Desulfobacteraceae bacterium]|nr:type II toxin-antitoxin system VapC family toxin [Desulfobacteraceae bacterium]
MNIVDTSGWLEYFAGGPNSAHFSRPLQDASSLIVPVITIYEVFKVVLREAGEDEALQSISAMQKGKGIELTLSLSMSAAKLGLQYNLPMADSIIFATAKKFQCVIWTQDAHFEDLPEVKFFPKTATGKRKK